MLDDKKFEQVDDVTAPPAVGAGLTVPAQPSSTNPTEAPAPVVVIEYRRGLLGRLAPPALILSAALAISSYQRTTTLHHFGPRSVPLTADAEPEAPKAKKSQGRIFARVIEKSEPKPANESGDVTPAAASGPVATETASIAAVAPPPEPPAVGAKEKLSVASPFDLDPVDGLLILDAPPARTTGAGAGFSASAPDPGPNASAPSSAPTPTPPDPTMAGLAETNPPDNAPEVSKDDILRDIQREADQKEAELRERDHLKPDARLSMMAENRARIDNNRVPFREELKEAVKNLGSRAGPEIDRLCDQYGRDTPREIHDRYIQARRIFPKRLTDRGEAEIMRSLGIPEPVILDFLAKKIHATMNKRGGPRDEEEVRVKAAQRLLSFPLPAPPKAAPSRGAAVAVPPAVRPAGNP